MKNMLIHSLFFLCILLLASCGSKKSDEEISDTTEDAVAEAEVEEIDAEDTNTEIVPDVSGAGGDAAATATGTYVDEGGHTVYHKAEIQPAFAGGEPEMTKWLQKNIKYPSQATEDGTVYVEFVVGEDGTIRNTKVLRGPEDPALREEAVKAVSSMPAWTPGQQGGKPVHSKFILPITFRKV